VRDYKGRTPLHLAAELGQYTSILRVFWIAFFHTYTLSFNPLDRSETARLLLELPDPAPAGVEDSSGQAAIVWMIKKMPPVVRKFFNILFSDPPLLLYPVGKAWVRTVPYNWSSKQATVLLPQLSRASKTRCNKLFIIQDDDQF
jgi:hypothetical protein